MTDERTQLVADAAVFPRSERRTKVAASRDNVFLFYHFQHSTDTGHT